MLLLFIAEFLSISKKPVRLLHVSNIHSFIPLHNIRPRVSVNFRYTGIHYVLGPVIGIASPSVFFIWWYSLIKSWSLVKKSLHSPCAGCTPSTVQTCPQRTSLKMICQIQIIATIMEVICPIVLSTVRIRSPMCQSIIISFIILRTSPLMLTCLRMHPSSRQACEDNLRDKAWW